ncbi:Uncharacterised protein [Bacillus freudenreichii]|nr:Uncharacterised protein [Bacillus freudenreichii]
MPFFLQLVQWRSSFNWLLAEPTTAFTSILAIVSSFSTPPIAQGINTSAATPYISSPDTTLMEVFPMTYPR